MKIIIDANGGDKAPQEPVIGGCRAARLFECEIIFAGDKEKIDFAVAGEGMTGDSRITVIHAPETIAMDDDPAMITKEKKNCSMAVALRLLADGGADALVSAGSTGALLTGATLFVRRIKGIRRAALAAILPSANGGVMLIDCGANTECTPEYLLQFGYMGSYYMQNVFARENARTGLLNVGSEETKGDALHRNAHVLLRGARGLNFIGNIEGRDVAAGSADVVVADGFSGNVLLKTTEGVGDYLAKSVKKMFTRSVLTKLAALTMKKPLAQFKKSMDYRETGGAPLLGINAPVIKSHGSADALCIQNAVRQAIAYAKTGIIGTISENIALMKTSDE